MLTIIETKNTNLKISDARYAASSLSFDPINALTLVIKHWPKNTPAIETRVWYWAENPRICSIIDILIGKLMENVLFN